MSKLEMSRDRRLYFKYSAKRAMSERGNLLRFVGATFIMLALIEAVIYLFETVCLFLGAKITGYLLAVELVILFIVSAPLIIGLSRMAYRMSLGENTEIGDILWAYDRLRVRDAYVLAITALADMLVLLVMSFAVGRCIAYAFEGIYAEFFSVPALIWSAIALPFLSGAFTRTFVLPAAYFESGSLTEAFSAAKKTVKGEAFEISAFNVSFMPLLFLSILTLGILFFVYFLPFYMLSAQLCASYFVGCTTPEYYRK